MEQRKQVAAIINLQNKKYERGQEMVEREFWGNKLHNLWKWRRGRAGELHSHSF
jgi:hypothetical protein